MHRPAADENRFIKARARSLYPIELVHDHSLSVTGASQPHAIELAIELLDVARKPSRRELRDGYIELLGDVDPTGPHPGQRWMTSRTLPLISTSAYGAHSADSC